MSTAHESSADAPPPPVLEFVTKHPASRGDVIHFHLTPYPKQLILHLTARAEGVVGQPSNLGSTVYSMPNLIKPKEGPLCTPLIARQDSVELATTLAKALAGRTGRAVLLSCDMGNGGDVGERIRVIKTVVDAVLSLVSVKKKEEKDGMK